MPYFSSRIKSALFLNIAYILTFVQKRLHRAKEQVKSLKVENFEKTSKERIPPNSGQF